MFDTFDCAMYGTVTGVINAIDSVVEATLGCKIKAELPLLVGQSAVWPR